MKKTWYTIEANKKKKKYYNVFILDEIGLFGVSARNFIKDLNEVEAEVINLHVDSPGGSITDGIAIYNALRAHPAQVDVYIDGIAASIASIIILAGDNVYIPENAGVFTHLPMLSDMEMPNRNDLDEGIEILGRFEKILTNIYTKHTGADDETVKGWMEKDTWFWGQEAVEAGFASEVVEKVSIAAKYDLEQYNFNGLHPVAQDVVETITQTNEEVIMTDDKTVDSLQVEIEAKDSQIAQLSAVVESIPEQIDEARDEAVDSAMTAENSRKESILAVSEKYDVDGDLAKVTVEALASDTDVEAFKDIVLEQVAKRPTAKKVEVQKQSADTVEALRAKLGEEKDPVQRGVIARKLRELR